MFDSGLPGDKVKLETSKPYLLIELDELLRVLPRIQRKARTLSTILNRYEENGQLCLVSDLSGITLSFSPFNLMLAVSLLYIAFIMFRKLSISFRFSNFMEYRLLKKCLISFFISSFDPVVIQLNVVQFPLKSVLLDTRRATPACFLVSFDWKDFSQPFTLRFCFKSGFVMEYLVFSVYGDFKFWWVGKVFFYDFVEYIFCAFELGKFHILFKSIYHLHKVIFKVGLVPLDIVDVGGGMFGQGEDNGFGGFGQRSRSCRLQSPVDCSHVVPLPRASYVTQ
ncbi:hypothetical protein STEG23_031023 [Scotinomys teguina]